MIKMLKKIPEAEMEIMKVIWSNEKAVSSKEIIGIMEERRSNTRKLNQWLT